MSKTITTKTILIPAFAIALAAAAPAFASDRNVSLPDVPREQWLDIPQIAEKLKSQGYEVRDIETKRRAYEVKLVDREGRRFEAMVNPATAELLQPGSNERRERKHQDDKGEKRW